MSDILNYFPKTDKIKEPRQCQIDVLNQVDELIESGETKIIICAPTGSGKSSIAVALLNKYGGIYTSPLNVLVDQISDDFEVRYLTTLKGREHYQCNANMNVSCAEGYCQMNKCSKPVVTKDLSGNIIKEYPKRNCKDCLEFSCPCHSCEYTKQKVKFKKSNIANTNFTMFQLGITNDKDMIVIDECDDIESFVRMNNSFTINEYLMYKDFADHVNVLMETEINMDMEIAELEIKIENEIDNAVAIKLFKECNTLKRKRANILKLLDDFEHNNKIWCVTHPDNRTTKYEPIVIDRFLNHLLENKIVILMSATPIKLEGYKIIEAGSNFPTELRQWKHIPLGLMSYNNREYTIPIVAQFIKSLRGKTLVHCNSYAVANSISKSLSILGIDALTQVNYDSMHPMECGRKDIVTRFKESVNENEIMLSVNLARGVDFPEDDITNNVFCVLPYPYHEDPLVKAKNKIFGTQWQNIDMANTIMQAYGRVNRNDKKTTMTYIVCSDFNNPDGRGKAKNWFGNNKYLFYDWFLDAEHHVNNGMYLCPVCKKQVDYLYVVSYEDYQGKICHGCNKKKKYKR